MPALGSRPGSTPSHAGPSTSLLDRHPGARLAAAGLFVAVVLALVTLRLWLPTQQEPCLPDEPTVAACRNVAPWVLTTALLAIASLITLLRAVVRDRRR